MLKAVLYLAFVACSLAMLMFVAGFAGWQLGLAWLTGALYQLAAKIILSAFALLSLLGAGLIMLAFYQGMLLYFRREAVAMRRVIRLQARQRDIGQRQLLEKRQIYYLSQLKRQSLLAADNKRHSHQLFKAISAELKSYCLPVGYQSLHKSLKQYHKQANPEAMLALRNQVLCR
jgi:hypothetical protein